MPKKSKPARLISENSLRLFNESQALADFAEDVLKTASAKLTRTILDASGSDLENSVSISAMRDLTRELDRHLAAAELSLLNHAEGAFSKGYQLQFESILEQVSTFEKALPSGLSESDLIRVARLKPRMSGDIIKATFESSLEKLSDSVSTLREPIRQKIAQNILTGGSYNDLLKEINSTGIIKGPFVTAEHRARAIAITETTNVYNAARYDSVTQSNRVFPEGKKLDFKWVALIDGKQSKRCNSLNGQVREQGKDFQASDGWRGKMPAAHPHCRSEVIPWRERWAPILEELEADLNSQ